MQCLLTLLKWAHLRSTLTPHSGTATQVCTGNFVGTLFLGCHAIIQLHRPRPCILVFYKTLEKVLLFTDWFLSPGGIFDGCDYAQNMDLNHVVQMVRDSLFWREENSFGQKTITLSII